MASVASGFQPCSHSCNLTKKNSKTFHQRLINQPSELHRTTFDGFPYWAELHSSSPLWWCCVTSSRAQWSTRTRHLEEEDEEIGTILCAERWCCLGSLLGHWVQSWTGRHSDTGYQKSWHSFCRTRKDDTQSQPHLVLNQQPSGIGTQDTKIPSL